MMYRKLLLIAPLLTMIVVVVGAYTRLTDSGLGCPDWPGCYGQLTAPDTAAEIARASERFPGAEIDPFKGWVEMIHRYLAGSLGLLILGIAVIAWRNHFRQAASAVRLPGSDAHWLGTGLMILLLVQALLGKFTVTLLLKPGIVTLHLLGGMLILALLFRMAIGEHVDRSRVAIDRAARFAPWVAAGIALLIGQIILGGWVSTNYAALTCLDFPTCHGSFLPPMDFQHGFHVLRELGEAPDGTPLSHESLNAIQWTHRVGALVVTTYLGILGVMAMRVPGVAGAAVAMLVLLAAQVTIGILNVVWLLPLWLATLHNFGAAVLLCAAVMLKFVVTRPVAVDAGAGSGTDAGKDAGAGAETSRAGTGSARAAHA
jgi:cytochrome c oxidase assembly protein subunit 15